MVNTQPGDSVEPASEHRTRDQNGQYCFRGGKKEILYSPHSETPFQVPSSRDGPGPPSKPHARKKPTAKGSPHKTCDSPQRPGQSHGVRGAVSRHSGRSGSGGHCASSHPCQIEAAAGSRSLLGPRHMATCRSPVGRHRPARGKASLASLAVYIFTSYVLIQQ